MSVMTDAEGLFIRLWERFQREVSVSYIGQDAELPWSVMVEGDLGSYGGETLVDALEHRLEAGPPERTTGWGADAI